MRKTLIIFLSLIYLASFGQMYYSSNIYLQPNFDGNAYAVWDFTDSTKMVKSGSEVSVVMDVKNNNTEALGSELITNGGYGSATKWIDSNSDGVADNCTKQLGGASIVSTFDGTGRAQRSIPNGEALGQIRYSTSMVSGKLYRYHIRYRSNASVNAYSTGFNGLTLASTGGVEMSIDGEAVSNSVNFTLYIYRVTNTEYVDIGELSIKEVTSCNLYQFTATKLPTYYKTSGVTTDGSNDFMTAKFASTLSQGFTVYMVVRPNSTTGSKNLFDCSTPNRCFVYTSARANRIAYNAGSNTEPMVYYSTTEFQVLTFKFNGSSSYVRRNLQNKSINFNPGTNGISDIFIGSNFNQSGQFINCSFLEMVIRPNDDDATSSQIIMGLAAKFGLSISVGNMTDDKLCVLGNSTIANTGNQGTVPSYMTTISQSNITDLSVGGATILDMYNSWMTLSAATKQSFEYVIVEIGLNDVPATNSVQFVMSGYQNLISSIYSDCSPGVKLMTATMTPAKTRFLTYWGATYGLIATKNWWDMNRCLRGLSGTDTTGASYQGIIGMTGSVHDHTDSLDDGNMRLKAIYELGPPNTPDGVHENTAARKIIARRWDAWIREH